MLSLFDMLENAQNGQAMDALSRQFNLTQKQTQDAMEALLPAFSQGLKRNAADPYGVGAFMSALASGRHARYFDDAANAFSPQGMAEGNGILGHLFGSKDLSRNVAAQAAQATGIGQDILKQMLPVLASMIMGGLFKQSTGQLGARPGGSGNIFGDLMEQMMRQGGAAPSGKAAPSGGSAGGAASPFDNPFGRMMEEMFGGGAQQPSSTGRQPGGVADNPLGQIFEEMLCGGQAVRPSAPEPQPEPRANPSGRPRNPYDDLFGDMFETGRKTRDNYEKGVESIFDRFRQGMEKRG